jgi:hypothetical protein
MPLWDADNRLADDKCAILARLRDNDSLLEYRFYDPYGRCKTPCQDRKRMLANFAAHHPNLHFWDGYGIAPCDVEGEGQLNHASAWTNAKERQHLPKRVFTSAPNLARGIIQPNTESVLISGEDTSSLRECGRLAERDFDRFVPGVQVQCVEHTVPSWTWGGDSSRDITRSKDFLASIGYTVDEDKHFTCYSQASTHPTKTATAGLDDDDDDLRGSRF